MQSKLDNFLLKKNNFAANQKQKKDTRYHESSRQNSQTQMIEHDSPMIVQQNIKVSVCHCLVLPGPCDTIYFTSIQTKLHKIKQSYNPSNKSVFYKFLEDNLKYERIQNVDILKKIDNPIFWKNTLPKMLNLIITKAQIVSTCIRTLVLGNNSVSLITRQQSLIILISMFLVIMPKNPLCRKRSFGQFMTKRETDRMDDLKLEKLKFIINYFITAIDKLDDKDFMSETITFQKSISNSQHAKQTFNTQNYTRDYPMLDVQFCQNINAKIEDFYGKAAMVDFANQYIGGGALGTGSVQQEILFLIFPQAIVSMLITPQMQQNQAIIIYGLRRYNNYLNYGYDLKFNGTYNHPQLIDVNHSIMIAIDAINFSSKISSQIQFKKDNTLRQIVKAFTGFSAIEYLADGNMKICTGRWGCGAFKGDQIWKFFIQWIACSQAGRTMIYTTDQEKILNQLRFTVKKILQKTMNTLTMLAIMESFMQIKQRSETPKDHTFIDFLFANI